MLILRRGKRQWLTIRHRSGDVLMMRVMAIGPDPQGPAGGEPVVTLGFEDKPHNFEIHRPGAPFRRTERRTPLGPLDCGVPPTPTPRAAD
ncbi:MAG: hypothetical protein U0790_00070 [Isosphaeraceae bacterium]